MKKYFAALTTTALISVAPFALAGPSTELTVSGVITPVACTPTLSVGAIDLGSISYNQLEQEQNTLVGSDDVSLTMNCDGPTGFAIIAIDNKAGSGIGDGFGLGLNDGNPVGFFTPLIQRVTADTAVVDPIESNDNGATWARTDSAKPGVWLSAAIPTSTTPIDAQIVTVDFKVNTYILRADELTLDGDLDLDGSATFEVMYL
jgi:type 1 fimbria pilin